MVSAAFIPPGFEPPTSLVTDQFLLEPLGPQHNEADHAAWTSSIEHIRATPGYRDRNWPPVDGMSLEANLADLRSHADDFTAGGGFTFTVLDPADGTVVGCVYLYPPESDGDVSVRSWVRADRSDLDHTWLRRSPTGSPPNGHGSRWSVLVVDTPGETGSAPGFATSIDATVVGVSCLPSPSVTKAGAPAPEMNLAAELSGWGVIRDSL